MGYDRPDLGNGVRTGLRVQDNQEFAAEYGIQGIPAFKVFKGGEVVQEGAGAMPAPSLKELIEKAL